MEKTELQTAINHAQRRMSFLEEKLNEHQRLVEIQASMQMEFVGAFNDFKKTLETIKNISQGSV